jgi:superfamily II DNA/RNA helicase
VIGNDQYKDPLRNAYYTRTRGLCNAVTLASGLVLSPKIDECVSSIRDNPGKKFAVYSNYLDLGIHAVAKKLKRAGVGYAMIDGSQSAEARERALRDYNAGKTKVILFSTAAGTGVNLMGTDVMVVLGVEFVESVQQQAEGRVARFHSHEPDSHVLILEYVSVLPDPDDLPEGEDLEALTELWMDLTRERDVKRARKAAATVFVQAIRDSMKEFQVSQTTEEVLLAGHARDAASSKPILDALALAGTWTADSSRRKLRKRLGFAEERDNARGLDPADVETFANFCRARKRAKIFQFVTGQELPKV